MTSCICQAHLYCLEKTYCGFALGDAQKTSDQMAAMDGFVGSEQAEPASSSQDGRNELAISPPLVFSEPFTAFAATFRSPSEWHTSVASRAAARCPQEPRCPVTALEETRPPGRGDLQGREAGSAPPGSANEGRRAELPQRGRAERGAPRPAAGAAASAAAEVSDGRGAAPVSPS